MKKHYLLPAIMLLFAFGILSQSNSGGPAASGSRATGAPGDGATTCITCHSGGSFGPVMIDVEVRDDSGNVISSYVPGNVYNLNVQVTSAGNPSGYGFQMIALRDNGNTTTNSFQSPGNFVRLSTTTGRQYAEHNQANPSGEFSVSWEAPEVGAGSVTFYVGANAVNGNGINSGDNASLFELTINELADTNGGINGLIDFVLTPSFIVYPNPASDFIRIDNPRVNNGPYKLYNSVGDLVKSYHSDEQTISLDQMPAGIYHLIQKDQHVSFLKY